MNTIRALRFLLLSIIIALVVMAGVYAVAIRDIRHNIHLLEVERIRGQELESKIRSMSIARGET